MKTKQIWVKSSLIDRYLKELKQEVLNTELMSESIIYFSEPEIIYHRQRDRFYWAWWKDQQPATPPESILSDWEELPGTDASGLPPCAEGCAWQQSHPGLGLDIFELMESHGFVPSTEKGRQERLAQWCSLTRDFKEGKRLVLLAGPTFERVFKVQYLQGDAFRANLPTLEESYLHDPDKGLWEIHFPEPPTRGTWVEVELPELWEARNPERDIRDSAVAIDFGTSSTVVAIHGGSGRVELLRVGPSNLLSEPMPKDYENPSVLRFMDWLKVKSVWTGKTYRPAVSKEWFQCSHLARQALQESGDVEAVVSSTLTRPKQWPLRSPLDTPLRLVDEQGHEFEIPPLQERLPVKGQPLQVSADDPFDPIELYAYYLGLFINLRTRGIFLRYYMTFPAEYPLDVKRKILASFARGLQRSLPESLLYSPRFSEFQVNERASEPLAYAACALEQFNVPLKESGVPYAVFDFGGGTTDFAFGLYRAPDADEADDYEHVIEQLGGGGDSFLGGENLVEHLAYLMFQENHEVCRAKRIPFTKPIDGEVRPGYELLIDHSRSARSNTNQMMSEMRKFWEQYGENHISSGTLKLTLLNRDGERVTETFKVNQRSLDTYLIRRVTEGILKFFVALKQSFQQQPALTEPVEVFLAGNSCKSQLVQKLFEMFIQSPHIGDGDEDEAERKRARTSKVMGAAFFMWAGSKPTANVKAALELSPEDMEWVKSVCRECLKVPDPSWDWEPEDSSEAEFHPHLVLRDVFDSDVYPEFRLNPPLPEASNEPFRPTAKTGVAIGVLKSLPGEPLKIMSRTAVSRPGEAPFRYYVGRYRQQVFHPIVMRDGSYHQWEELGRPVDGAFNLVHSTSPLSAERVIPRGSSELKEQRLFLDGPVEGRRLFVMPVDPNTIELCVADSVEQITQSPDAVTNRQRILLG
jgi:hypothetical protein